MNFNTNLIDSININKYLWLLFLAHEWHVNEVIGVLLIFDSGDIIYINLNEFSQINFKIVLLCTEIIKVHWNKENLFYIFHVSYTLALCSSTGQSDLRNYIIFRSLCVVSAYDEQKVFLPYLFIYFLTQYAYI